MKCKSEIYHFIYLFIIHLGWCKKKKPSQRQYCVGGIVTVPPLCGKTLIITHAIIINSFFFLENRTTLRKKK